MMVGRLWWKIFLKFKKTHISITNLKRLVDRWWWWAGCGGRKQRFCASNYHHQHHHPAKKHTWDWESKYLSKLGSLGGVFWGRSMPPIITTSTTTRNTHGNGNPKYHNQTTTTIKNSAPLPCQETHLGERGGDRDHIFIKIWNFWGGILRQKYGLKHVFFPEDLGPDFWRHWKGTTEKCWYRQWVQLMLWCSSNSFLIDIIEGGRYTKAIYHDLLLLSRCLREDHSWLIRVQIWKTY